MQISRIYQLRCQICKQLNDLPLKLISGVYWHVQCLVCLNLLRFENRLMRLTRSSQEIKIMIAENEQQFNECEICKSEVGFTFKCLYCRKVVHVPCGYLMGYEINIQRVNDQIEISVCCMEHQAMDQHQLMWECYLRRFPINYINAMEMKFEEFAIYLKKNYSHLYS